MTPKETHGVQGIIKYNRGGLELSRGTLQGPRKTPVCPLDGAQTLQRSRLLLLLLLCLFRREPAEYAERIEFKQSINIRTSNTDR